LKSDLVNGKPGYFLKIGERAYYIEPQVEIGKPDGVSVPSRADFVIRAARVNDAMKPVAVFLDGYAYHRDRVGEDMAQRMAIVQSGKFHVWSMSWHDVENVFKTQKDFYVDFLDPSGLPAGNNFDTLLTGYGLSDLMGLNKLNSFDLLVRFLQNPEEDKWRLFTFVFSLLHIDAVKFAKQEAVENWTSELEINMPEEIAEKIKETDCPCLYGLLTAKSHEDNVQLQQFVVNLFQFLPLAFFVTKEGLKKKAYDGIKLFDEMIPSGDGPSVEPEQESWHEIREITDKTLHGLLDMLRNNDWPVPEAGYELQNSEGEIIASAELAWEELKIAFLLDEELEFESRFVNAQWKVYSLKDVLKDPDKYVALNNRQEE
jgi:DEAD/DEAH box helicase domain-containing protein